MFHAVANLQFAELLATCVGLSPTSPKKGSSVGPGCANQRGHLQVPVEVAESCGMRGFGRAPSAPVFMIPKNESKCPFIVNCTLGNWAHKGTMPRMALPNLHTLRQKFLKWAAMPQSRSPDRVMIKLDLTNCYFSLKIPQFAWGTFRVQGPRD